MDEGHWDAGLGRRMFDSTLISVDNFVKNFQSFDGFSTSVSCKISGFFRIDVKKLNEIKDLLAIGG